MRTLFGTVAGALALGAVLVAYDLGARQTFNQDAAAMTVGYQQGQPYGAPFAAQSPYGMATPTAPAAGYGYPQYVNQQAAMPQPAVQRVSSPRTYATERVATPTRDPQQS